jgi:UDP-N-acetylmuramyl pentapeptide phosphotransferase/UDP-N-acetylglucosamine-1-phosphate transferase
VKGLQRSLVLALVFGLVVAAFIFPSAFAQELKGQDAFIRESLKAYVPLMVGLGVGLAVWIGVSARRSR